MTAHCLVDANLRGLDTHGVLILRLYLPRLASGAIDGTARPRVVTDQPAAALVDGCNALGAVHRDVRRRPLLREGPSGGRGLRRGARLEPLRRRVRATPSAPPRGAASRSSARTAIPAWPRRARCVPFSAPIPSRSPRPGRPTSACPASTWRRASSRSARSASPRSPARADPAGMGDRARRAATRAIPAEALAGSLLPMAAHKGFALAFMLDVLAGCVPGASVSPEHPGLGRRPRAAGHRPSRVRARRQRAFSPPDAYEERLRVARARRARRRPRTRRRAVPDPGRARGRDAARRAPGAIPVPAGQLELLAGLGERFGVPFPGGAA